MVRCRGGKVALSAALRYQLMRAVLGVCPCGVNLRLISRAAALAAWACYLHQTLDSPDLQSAIALVLPRRPSREVGRLGKTLSLIHISEPTRPY